MANDIDLRMAASVVGGVVGICTLGAVAPRVLSRDKETETAGDGLASALIAPWARDPRGWGRFPRGARAELSLEGWWGLAGDRVRGSLLGRAWPVGI